MAKYYAVKEGREPGIYDSWDECKLQTEGYSGAVFKSFKTREEAESFLNTMSNDEENLPVIPLHQKIINKEKSLEPFLNDEQRVVFEAMKNGENIYLSGEGGTGKSFLVDAFACYCEENRINLIKAAPTGVAAVNIGGLTLHKLFKLPPHPLIEDPKFVNEIVRNADIILIDEISMCRIDMFEYIIKYIQLANKRRRGRKKIQLIVCGDFYQLPPVVTEKDKQVLNAYYGVEDLKGAYAFMSPLWNDYHLKTYTLTTPMRKKNDDFVNALNKARIGDQSCITWLNEHTAAHPMPNAPTLYGTNKAAKQRNDAELKKLDTPMHSFHADVIGEFNPSQSTAEETLDLKEGARVMFLVNDTEGDEYYNGSMGVVTKIEDNGNQSSVTVRLDHTGKEVTISTYEWKSYEYLVDTEIDEMTMKERKVLVPEETGALIQFPIKLAYAITIHKSQSQTLDALNVMPYAWAPGQLYVALSRCTSADHLYLQRKLTGRELVVSEEVIRFEEDPERYSFFSEEEYGTE